MKTNFERGQLNAQDDLNENFSVIEQFMQQHFKEFFQHGAKTANPTGSQTLLPIGESVGVQTAEMATKRPYTVSEDRQVLTITRACCLAFDFNVLIHGLGNDSTSSDYVYLYVKKNQTEEQMVGGLGSPVGQRLNLQQSMPCKAVSVCEVGDQLSFSLRMREGKFVLGATLLHGVIEEIYG